MVDPARVPRGPERSPEKHEGVAEATPSGVHRTNGGRLDGPDVGRLITLGAGHHVELDLLTLGQRPEPLGTDRGVVDEDVAPILARDEAVPLGIVEPLHSTFFHCDLLACAATARRKAAALTF